MVENDGPFDLNDKAEADEHFICDQSQQNAHSILDQEDVVQEGEQHQPKLKIEKTPIYKLDENSVLELRALCHRPCFGVDARLPDENFRLYEILSYLPGFAKALQPLPFTARLHVVRALAPRSIYSRDLLLRNTDNETLDVACVVLRGEATLYVVSAGEGRQAFQRLAEGSEVTPDMIDERNINPECRSSYELQVGSKHTIEVLRLPAKLLEDAIIAEERLEIDRTVVRDILNQRPPWSREREELFTISAHFVKNCESFEGVPEEDIAKVVQQAELIHATRGDRLCRRGGAADGLRVLLSGYASVYDSNGDCIRTIGVDETVGEWELCFSHEDYYDIDVFVDGDCEVCFISRALYTRYMRPARCRKALQNAALASLLSSSAEVCVGQRESAEASCRGRLDTSESSGLGLTMFSGNLESNHVTIVTALARTLPESVAAIDCMLGYHNDPKLAVIRSFSQDIRRQIWGQAKFLRASRGEVIFCESDPSDAIFIVVRGQIGLFQLREENDEITIKQNEELARQLDKQVSVAVENQNIRRGTKSLEESQLLQNLHSCEEKQTPMQVVKTSCEAVTACIASSLFEVAARRSQNLQSARVSTLPEREAKRMFIRDSRAEQMLLGNELPTSHTNPAGDIFLDIAQIGVCSEIVQEGCATEIIKLDLEYSPELMHTGVALSPTLDLLVIEKTAMTEVLWRVFEGCPSGQSASEILQSRQGLERTPQDLLVLDALINRHRPFKHLECRARAEICRKMSLAGVPSGELLWTQGDPTFGFFQILHGIVNVHINVPSSHCNLKNEDALDGEEELGDFALCLGEGATFGEEAFLKEQEVQPLTLRATEDVELAWIQLEDYQVATQDWLGEASGRRRALEVLRRPMMEWVIKDINVVAKVLQRVPQLQDMEIDALMELARLGTLLTIPSGEQVPFDEVLHPLSIVLSGCIGHYRMKEEDDSKSPRIVLSSCSGSTKSQTKVPKKSIAPAYYDDDDEQASDDTAAFRAHYEIEQLRNLSQEMSADMREPLKCSLRKRLKFHAVNVKINALEKKLNEIAPNFAAELAKRKTTNASGSTLGLRDDSMDLQGSNPGLLHDGGLLAQSSHTSLGPQVGSNAEYDLVGSGKVFSRDSPNPTFELTQMDVDGDGYLEEHSNMLDVSECDVELREGETFGGWTEATPTATTFRAHAETELLLISHSAYLKAMELAKQKRIRENADFLRSHLPSRTPLDVIEKIAPCCTKEVKHRGNILVREGSSTNTVWIVVEGACQCKIQHGRQAISSGVAHDGATKSNHHGDVSTLAIAGSRSSTTSSHMPTILGILEEGKFVGLTSALFPNETEPSTVEVSSAYVRLLAISKHDFVSRVHGRVVDTLKDVVRHQNDLHATQTARIAALPGQIAQKFNDVRVEVHEASLPRLIDSPFLRRQGQPGLDSLDHICERFGSFVHPESEWLFASRDPSFFQSVRLANLESGHPEAAFWTGISNKKSPTERQQTQHGPANWRFQRFTQLSRSFQGASLDSSLASQLSPQSVSQVAALACAQGNLHDRDRSSNTNSVPVDSVEHCHETHIPLLKPSRVHNNTEYSETRVQIKTGKTSVAAPKSARSPGRIVPVKAQTFKSKAMRDLQGPAVNNKLGTKDDTISSPPRQNPSPPRHLVPTSSQPIDIGGRNQKLPPISFLSDGSYFFDGHEPNPFLPRPLESASPNKKSLRRGREKAAARLRQVADTNLQIMPPGERMRDDCENRRMSSGWAGDGRPSVWRRGRLAALLGSDYEVD